MKTHAEVHEAVEEICHGTRLNEFMIETKSFRHEDGSITVEWACCIGSGRKYPEFFSRSRDPEMLVEAVRKGVELRRPMFAIADRSLDTLRGTPPKDTALPDPPPTKPLECQTFTTDRRHYDPTGEF